MVKFPDEPFKLPLQVERQLVRVRDVRGRTRYRRSVRRVENILSDMIVIGAPFEDLMRGRVIRELTIGNNIHQLCSLGILTRITRLR